MSLKLSWPAPPSLPVGEAASVRTILSKRALTAAEGQEGKPLGTRRASLVLLRLLNTELLVTGRALCVLEAPAAERGWRERDVCTGANRFLGC